MGRLALLVGLLALPGAAVAVDLPMPPPPTGMRRLDETAKPEGTPLQREAPGALPRILVSDLAAQGVSPEEAAAITDALVQTLATRGTFRVISNKELMAIVGAERRRQLLGICSERPEACATDLGGQTGARFILIGSLSRLGATYQLSLQMLDSVKGQPLSRSSRLAGDLDTLRAQVPYAAAEATGSPLPPPPSKVLQVSMVAAGSTAFVAGGFLGMLALSRQGVLNDELCPGGPQGDRCAGINLRPRDYYLEQQSQLSGQKGLGLGLMVAGLALAGAGAYLWPPPEGGPRLSLVPSSSGMALVGELP